MGVWKLSIKKIFDVTSYEISSPRAKYAKEKLDVNILNKSELDALRNDDKKFDFFFMSHVLEHVPNPSETLDLGLKLLKKNGYIVSFTPNGSMEYRKINSDWSLFYLKIQTHAKGDVKRVDFISAATGPDRGVERVPI